MLEGFETEPIDTDLLARALRCNRDPTGPGCVDTTASFFQQTGCTAECVQVRALLAIVKLGASLLPRMLYLRAPCATPL